MKKILIIRFSSIGDIVLTTPVLRCIHEQVKDVEIHYLTKANFQSLLSANPYITKIHLLGDNLKATISALKKEQFDEVIDLHYNLRTWRVKSALHVKSYSFAKLNWEKFLLVKFKVNRMPTVHIVDRYLETAKHLGVVNDGKGLDFFIPPSVSVEMDSLPETHQQGFIAIVIGAAHFTKRLPIQTAIKVIKGLNEAVVLLGGPEDALNGELIAKEVGTMVFNGCGKFSLLESARLIELSKRVLSNDTGLMHIAAALDKQTVSVWGNTVPELGMYSYFNKQSKNKPIILEIKDLKCRPCSKIGFDKCPKGHFKCMEMISASTIVEQLKG